MSFLETISTGAVEPSLRLRHWNTSVRERFAGMTVDGAPDMIAHMRSCRLGSVTVTLARSQRASITRWRDGAPPGGGTRRLLHVQHEGSSLTEQNGSCVPIAAGDMTHCIPDLPYGIQLSDRNAMIVVDAEQSALGLEGDRTCDLIARGTPALSLLHDFTSSLLRQHWPDIVDDDDAAVLEQTVLGLARSCLRSLPPEPWVEVPRDERQRVLAYIEHHLDDSTLRTGSIAAALSLPSRTVQTVFTSMATTPGAYIISRRLGRAAEMLTSRPDVPVTALAYEFGFSDAAHLCRRFKQRFGVSPGRYVRLREADGG